MLRRAVGAPRQGCETRDPVRCLGAGRSGPDDPAVLAPDRDRRRARPPAGLAVGPVLIAFGLRGSLRPGCGSGASPGCWMLTNIVRRSGVSCTRGDLAAHRPGEEAPHLAGGRVGGHHLVVADAAPSRRCAMFCADESVWIHSTPRASMWQPSGCAKATPPFDVAALERIGVRRVARLQEDVPVEAGGGGVAAGFAPAHDVAHQVGRARIGGVGAERGRPGAAACPLPRDVLLLSVT